ncbi:MAG: hypothetical protein N3A54_04775 [Patescibacteria group bacterium]|nr:hypothetical protein [Patescibacteria group bacterium]
MPYSEILPASRIPEVSLPIKGDVSKVNSPDHPLPYSLYTENEDFLQACAEQVTFVYYQLGGGQLNIELDEYTVYQTYQQAVLEYSELINTHQAINVLSSALGNKIGKFDGSGRLILEDGYVEPGSHVELKYPQFDFTFARHVADLIGTVSEVGGNSTWYKASFPLVAGQQDYNLQKILEDQSQNPESEFYNKIDLTSSGRRKVNIQKVYYKSPKTMWRFYGFISGGMSVLGNLSTYGMFRDDATFEVVPTWQNRLQAMTYKDNMHVRTAHYSFRLVNNILRLFPVPDGIYPDRMWIEFTLPLNVWEDTGTANSGVNGVNNINTLPFENIPFEFINAIGKNWIRKYSLALCKIILGNTRSKIQQLPFANSGLNGSELISQGKEEMKELKENYLKILEKTTYDALSESEKKMAKNAVDTLSVFPSAIFVG